MDMFPSCHGPRMEQELKLLNKLMLVVIYKVSEDTVRVNSTSHRHMSIRTGAVEQRT